MSLPVIGGRVTPEELLEMEGAYELLEGKLVERWASRSSMLTSLNVARIVSGFLERFPIGELYGSGLGIRVFRDRDRVRKASLSFVRTSRIPAGDFGFLEVPPDLVIEVLSPSNRGARCASRSKNGSTTASPRPGFSTRSAAKSTCTGTTPRPAS